MFLIASGSAMLIVVNLVFAAIALAVGFAAGAWVCGGAKAPITPSVENPAIDSDRTEELKLQQLIMERTMMASDRLRDLAASVATDVDAHTANIGAIEAQLSSQKSDGSASSDAVFAALTQIEQANHDLQSKLARAEEQIQSQAALIRTHESEARTDSLTGLANRRAFDDEINRRFAEWERRGTPFSLLILDVDHFKAFNDTHGHQAGDEVLRKVAKAINGCVREMDLACRYGGEEFAVVMPTTESADGCVLAERVRTAIEALVVPFEGKELSVTASVGLAGIAVEDKLGGLVKRADEALYASKDAGRNNAHRHTGVSCVPIKNAKDVASKGPAGPPDLGIDALPNRTRFLEILRTEIRTSQEDRTPLSLLTARFDGYTKLEQEYGDAVAKLTLDSVAQFLDSALDGEERLGRINDFTFVAILPEHSRQQADEVGDRINTALAKCAVPLGEQELNLTTTMAATEMTSDDTAVSLMARAEEGAGIEVPASLAMA
ncbi:GGDEF domain-containing protein [Botrimarina mediterranea]|uniref:GGDEF domain-containing protein n=1 Tax=Botrimarina mediterranea TaxID=2528022 RepID=UPI00118B7EF0|nr:Response regulator PleD [Planctomycetes bacterium K2D]